MKSSLNPNAKSFTAKDGKLSVEAGEFVPWSLTSYVKKFVSCLNPEHYVHIKISRATRRVSMQELSHHFPGVTGRLIDANNMHALT